VNGERRQSNNTSDMIFNVKTIISYASQHFTLKPGDIFFTGTPEGVIFGKPRISRCGSSRRQDHHGDRKAW